MGEEIKSEVKQLSTNIRMAAEQAFSSCGEIDLSKLTPLLEKVNRSQISTVADQLHANNSDDITMPSVQLLHHGPDNSLSAIVFNGGYLPDCDSTGRVYPYVLKPWQEQGE